jgi:hypothetical protein
VFHSATGKLRTWSHRSVNVVMLCLAIAFSLTAIDRAHAQTDNFWLYRVEPGDTLIGIAQRYLIDGARWREVQDLNGVKQTRRLQPGAFLRIPSEKTKIGPVLATAVAVSGRVERQLGGAGEKVSLKLNDQVKQGDRVSSGADASLKLEFVDGSYVQLQRDTIVTFKLLQGQAAARLSSVQIVVEQGRVETMVKPLKSKVMRYEVLTPTVQIGVRGTNFRVNFDAAGALSRSEVLDGAVNARNDFGSENIPKDFGTVILPNAAPLPPIPLLPAPKVDGIPALIDASPVRLTWESIVGATQYRAQLATTADFSNVIVDHLVTAPDATFADVPDGRYYLRIRAIDNNGLEGKNAERAIDIKARPAPPLSEPVRLELPLQEPALLPPVLQGHTLRVAWSDVGSGKRVRLQVAWDRAFNKIQVDRSTAQHYVEFYSPAGGEYFVRAALVNEDGFSAPFGTAYRIAIPSLSDPPGWLSLSLLPIQ